MKDRADGLGERLTVTLAPGQRALLEEIAQRNQTTLAWVVRFALTKFARQYCSDEEQLELSNHA